MLKIQVTMLSGWLKNIMTGTGGGGQGKGSMRKSLARCAEA